MNTTSVPFKDSVPTPASTVKATSATTSMKGATSKLSLQNLLSVPLACGIGIGIHFAVLKNDPEPDTSSYAIFLGSILGSSLLLSMVQVVSSPLRRWMAHMHPIIAASVALL